MTISISIFGLFMFCLGAFVGALFTKECMNETEFKEYCKLRAMDHEELMGFLQRWEEYKKEHADK